MKRKLEPRPRMVFSREAVLDASKDAGLEKNGEKTKYILMSRSRNKGQNTA
jgi:hypothetical protein